MIIEIEFKDQKVLEKTIDALEGMLADYPSYNDYYACVESLCEKLEKAIQ